MRSVGRLVSALVPFGLADLRGRRNIGTALLAMVGPAFAPFVLGPVFALPSEAWDGWMPWMMLGATGLLMFALPYGVGRLGFVPEDELDRDRPVTDAGRSLGRSWARVGRDTFFVADAMERPTRPSGQRLELDGFVLPLFRQRMHWPTWAWLSFPVGGSVRLGVAVGLTVALLRLTFLDVDADVQFGFGSWTQAGWSALIAAVMAGLGLLVGLLCEVLTLVAGASMGLLLDAAARRPAETVPVRLSRRVLSVGPEPTARFHLDAPGQRLTLDRERGRLELVNDRERVVLEGELGGLDWLFHVLSELERRDLERGETVPAALVRLMES